MTEEDLKLVIESYQRKSFELFNQNVILEVQVSTLRKSLEQLTQENEKLNKVKKPIKDNNEF